jgi:hypothetical protein
MSAIRLFQIFRAGQHAAMSGQVLTFSESDLAATAAAYAAQKDAAPLVLGHPPGNRPAFGKVMKLIAKGGELYAFADVSPQLIEWVRAGRYRKISASFYTPRASANPVPGIFALRHVGFLGAASPAVKGMADPAFADSAAHVEFADAGGGAMPPRHDAEFSMPAGYSASPDRTEMHARAQSFIASCPFLTYVEAAGYAEALAPTCHQFRG